MKVIGINGSPRKDANTGTMLDFAMRGAKAEGADVERTDLFDLSFRGCYSCFECKRLGGGSFGRCAVRDDLFEVLGKALEADVLMIASPIYFGDVTGGVRSLLERLWFPSLLYSAAGKIAYDRKLKVGMIYTMNVSDPMAVGYGELFDRIESTMTRFVGETETIYAADTYQFSDYSKYASDMFDAAEKKKTHEEKFPQDCERAYGFGAGLVRKASGDGSL